MKLITALLLVFGLVGCAVAPQKYTFETTYPDTKRVEIHFVTTQEKNGVAILQGSLFQKHHRPVPQSGHIDIAAYNPAGGLILQTVAPYQAPMNAGHAWSKTGVRFFASLPAVPPSGSTIKMAFHVNKEWPKTQQPHSTSIALSSNAL